MVNVMLIGRPMPHVPKVLAGLLYHKTLRYTYTLITEGFHLVANYNYFKCDSNSLHIASIVLLCWLLQDASIVRPHLLIMTPTTVHQPYNNSLTNHMVCISCHVIPLHIVIDGLGDITNTHTQHTQHTNTHTY